MGLACPAEGRIFGLMGLAWAIFGAGVAVALAILISFRWEIASPGVVRLDRWTGTIVLCDVGDSRPAKADCEPK